MIRGNSGSVVGNAVGASSDPLQGAPGMDGVESDDKAPRDPKEKAVVAKVAKGYEAARKFDEAFRKQVVIDRRYAAGTSDLTWAVTTNLIGAFIDILVALLYARDPDVSVKKAAQVDESGTRDTEVFAKTLELVISRLWKDGKLKKAARKGVRSVLSNSAGWLKATMISEKEPNAEVEAALNDARETHARLVAQQELIDTDDQGDADAKESMLAEKAALIAELEGKVELAIARMFVIDFAPTEYMQVSSDVSSISDYLDANWVGNEVYLEKDDVLARFPRLTVEDLKSAKLYYQNAPKNMNTTDLNPITPQGQVTTEAALAYSPSQVDPECPPSYRVIEQWDRRDKHIRTFIDGVEAWAKEPFLPPYPTKRFYPYFYFSFYEVDGQRHPQSLAWRLYKLQDEYSSVRSSFRITRARSVPAVLFNATQLDDIEVQKITKAQEQEFIGIRTTTPDIPLANVFAPKPVAAIDIRVYDPTYILNDMERLSGVQEALSSGAKGPGNPITAAEANIQQSGTNARTSADRDNLEEMLTELANYTAQQALQCLTTKDAQRIAGKKAFWPEGMDIADLFTMVEVQITAGSTGKPRQGTDQQAWATILPMIQQMIGQIEQALAQGNQPLAQALTELIKETMLRLGDETDPTRFIPQVPPPGTPGAGAKPQPPPPAVSISLRGELDPMTAAKIAAPTAELDAHTAMEIAAGYADAQNAAPGAGPANASPAIPLAGGPGAPGAAP